MGVIHYVEASFPLAPVRRLVDEAIRDASFRVEHVGELRRLSTLEGEHAACVTVHGTIEGSSVQRDFGFVLLDRTYARVEGLVVDPALFAVFTAVVEELTRGDVHFLGVRQRRFEYAAPPGWQARARGLHADWYPPGYPRRRARLHVLPALPAEAVGQSGGFLALVADDEARTGWKTEELGDAEDVHSEHGLSGRMMSYVGRFPSEPAMRRTLAVLEDERYVYPLRLDAALDEPDLATVPAALVRSVRAVPRPTRVATTAFSHWAE